MKKEGEKKENKTGQVNQRGLKMETRVRKKIEKLSREMGIDYSIAPSGVITKIDKRAKEIIAHEGPTVVYRAFVKAGFY